MKENLDTINRTLLPDEIEKNEADLWVTELKSSCRSEEGILPFEQEEMPHVLTRDTYNSLVGEDPENTAIRIYLGIDTDNTLCVYAVPAKKALVKYPDGQIIEEYTDITNKLYKLFPDRNIAVYDKGVYIAKQDMKRWQEKRKTLFNLDNKDFSYSFIYPVSMLFTIIEMEEVFNEEQNNYVEIHFGMQHSFKSFIKTSKRIRNHYFDFARPCPPICDKKSPYITFSEE
ncbi:MAG: hypothetical protein ACEPOV_05955 [Hyphomicrobiales bacterium]